MRLLIKQRVFSWTDSYDVYDENENPKTEFKPGDIIKVMIPKKEILENSKLKIYYTKTMEDFPVYYTASKIEGRQNYVILLDKTRESTGTINFDVGGDKSELQIVKIDAETSRPLEGVTFSITYEDGKVFTCTTDENGIANCKGLYQGKVVIKETATKEGYILDEQETELELGYKEFCILSFSSEFVNVFSK